MGNWTPKLQSLLGLFLESNCPLCQRPTAEIFCRDCQRQIQRCQLPNSAPFGQGQLPVFAWGLYGGTLKRAIAVLKYDNQPQIARPLGHWLAQSWLASPLRQAVPRSVTKLTVVPIPMHAAKQQQRGYNQAELLAQSFCEVTGLPLQLQGLQRVRATEAQFNLSVAAREQNLTDAFSLGKGLRQHRASDAVLLLDDIYTTGATARAAMHTLRQQGIAVYGLAAVAQAR